MSDILAEEERERGKSGKQTFIKGAIILSLCGVLGKILGAVYRIPLTNILGAEGIGLYQIVFPVYALLLTISSTGLPTAISRMIAEKRALGDFDGAHDVHRVTFRSLLLTGTLIAIAVFLLSGVIAKIQGNALAGLAYKGIAPSIICVAIISSYRGYFQGRRNMTPSAISQLTEQAVKMVVGLILAKLLLPYGVEYGVFGAVLGVSASEFVTMLSLMFIKNRQRDALSDNYIPQKKFQVLKELYKIALPITLGGLILPLTQMIDSVMIINILKGTYSAGEATAMYGLATGPVNTLINMPAVISLSIGAAALPSISHSRQIGDKEALSREIGEIIKLTMIFTLPCFIGMLILPRPIITLLYGRSLSSDELDLASQLLQASSVGVLYLSLLQVFTAVIQGTGKSIIPVINLLIGAVVKIILTAILLKFIGVLGSVIANVACYMVSAVLNSVYLKKHMETELNISGNFLLPLLAAGISCMGAYYIHFGLTNVLGTNKALIIAVISAIVIYVFLLAVLKVFDPIKFFRSHFRGKRAKNSLVNKFK